MDGSQGTGFSSPLLQTDDSNLYVTAFGGGQFNCGTILKLNTAGKLLSQYNFQCKKHGAYPDGAIIQATDGNLYGTTSAGGYATKRCSEGCGTIYQLTPQGVVTLIHLFQEFDWWDAEGPGGLVEGTDANLYGVSVSGGSGYGSIYMTSTSGLKRLSGVIPAPAVAWAASRNTFDTGHERDFLRHIHCGAHEEGTLYSLDIGQGPFVTFVQATSKVGGTAQILGQGLTGATSVTFNGIAASTFYVNSDTSMTAAVLLCASTGPVVVTTLGGTLTSNVSFRISK